MKRMNNKGQGAMEYLMTYGWAILVVMIVGVVLWQLGVFGGAGGGVNRATGFTTLKPFDRSIQASATSINATLTNAAGTPLTIIRTNATVNGVACTALRVGGVVFGGTTAGSLPIAGGDTAKFDCTTTLVKGNTFTVSVNIAYTESVAGTTITRTDSGRLTGTFK